MMMVMMVICAAAASAESMLHARSEVCVYLRVESRECSLDDDDV